MSACFFMHDMSWGWGVLMAIGWIAVWALVIGGALALCVTAGARLRVTCSSSAWRPARSRARSRAGSGARSAGPAPRRPPPERSDHVPFPDWGAARIVIDAGFGPGFHAWGALAAALGWAISLAAAVAHVLRRSLIAAD